MPTGVPERTEDAVTQPVPDSDEETRGADVAPEEAAAVVAHASTWLAEHPLLPAVDESDDTASLEWQPKGIPDQDLPYDPEFFTENQERVEGALRVVGSEVGDEVDPATARRFAALWAYYALQEPSDHRWVVVQLAYPALVGMLDYAPSDAFRLYLAEDLLNSELLTRYGNG